MQRRLLSPTEIAEARLVFGSGLDYTRAFVAENARWPDWVDNLGMMLQGRRRGLREHNAVTLGSTSYFPVRLETTPEALASGHVRDMCWLIHELAHQWQYQHMGWRYLKDALGVQLRLGRAAYNYMRDFDNPQSALRAALERGHRLKNFNLEQQGDLARDYYFALKGGQDPSPWEPFVGEFRAGGRLA